MNLQFKKKAKRKIILWAAALGLLHPALGLRADAPYGNGGGSEAVGGSVTGPVLNGSGTQALPTNGAGTSVSPQVSPSSATGTASTLLQESTPSNVDQPVTRAEINGLAGDINELRDDMNFNYQRLTANTKRPVTIDGLIQTRYTIDHDTTDYPDQFSIPFATLTAVGTLFTDYAGGHNLNFSIGLQYGAVGYVPTTATTSANAAFALGDGYLQYVLLPIVDPTKPLLEVNFGQQQKPYGVEPQVADSLKPTINPALWAGPTGFNFSGRDIGLQVLGDLLPNVDFGNNYRIPALQYQLGVFNGNGANTSYDAILLPGGDEGPKAPGTVSNPGGNAWNGSNYSYSSVTEAHPVKDLYGRVDWNAPVDYDSPWRGLTIGASGYQDHTPVTLAPDTSIPAWVVNEDSERDVYGGDITYANVPVGFTTEFVKGDTHNLASSLISGSHYWVRTYDQESYGATATLFYEFGQQFNPDYINQTKADDYYPKTYQLFVRSDTWNPNTGIEANSVTEGTVGFNAFFASTTKFQINYQLRRPEGQSFHYDETLAQFQYGF
jgi:hypothetical protein